MWANGGTDMMKPIVAFRNFGTRLKMNINVNHTKKISPYRAVNTLRLGYKNQPVNAVQGYNRCLFSDPHNTNK